MKKEFWHPKWWIFLPTTLPVVAFLWLQLGVRLQLPASMPLHAGPLANHPEWMVMSYYAVQHVLWILLSPGPGLLLSMHGNPSGAPWMFWTAILGSVIFDCLALYGVLLSARCGNERFYAKS
jgi:hypothetical protein